MTNLTTQKITKIAKSLGFEIGVGSVSITPMGRSEYFDIELNDGQFYIHANIRLSDHSVGAKRFFDHILFSFDDTVEKVFDCLNQIKTKFEQDVAQKKENKSIQEKEINLLTEQLNCLLKKLSNRQKDKILHKMQKEKNYGNNHLINFLNSTINELKHQAC